MSNTKKKIDKLNNLIKADEVSNDFFVALKQENMKSIEEHIKNGVNIKKKNLHGLNPLHMAAQMGNSRLIDLFLAKGVGINLLSRSKHTALHIAVKQQHMDIVKQLLKYGAKINTQNSDGDSPLHVATRYGNFDLVHLLLDHGANPNMKNNANTSAFLLSFRATDNRLMKLFLKYNINACQKNDSGENALHLAARFGTSDVVQSLLEMEINPNVVTYVGLTPLHCAVINDKFPDDRLAIIRSLVEYGSDIDREDKHGHTPLYAAVDNNSSVTVMYLVEMGARVNHEARNGSTPLIVAVELFNVLTINYLLEHGAKAQGKNGEGDGLLHIAILASSNLDLQYKVIEKLLAHGASINERNADKSTPLHITLHFGHAQLVDLLIRSDTDIHAKDSRNRSILQLAVIRNLHEVVLKLLAMGANPNDYDCEGNGILANAIHLKNEQMVRTLLEYGADPTRNGAVHEAAERGNEKIMKILVDHGADINYTRKRELTPLHRAIEFGRCPMVRYLLGKGANINTTDLSNLPLRKAITLLNTERTNHKFKYIVSIMIKHIALLVARDQYVHQENMQLIRKQSNLSTCFDNYFKELMDMKNIKVKGTNVSYFDLLNKRNNALVNCLRYESVRRAVNHDDHKKLFPNYFDYLDNNCLPAMARLRLISVVATSLHTVFQLVLPYEVTSTIVERLTTNDLKNYTSLSELF